MGKLLSLGPHGIWVESGISFGLESLRDCCIKRLRWAALTVYHEPLTYLPRGSILRRTVAKKHIFKDSLSSGCTGPIVKVCNKPNGNWKLSAPLLDLTVFTIGCMSTLHYNFVTTTWLRLRRDTFVVKIIALFLVNSYPRAFLVCFRKCSHANIFFSKLCKHAALISFGILHRLTHSLHQTGVQIKKPYGFFWYSWLVEKKI